MLKFFDDIKDNLIKKFLIPYIQDFATLGNIHINKQENRITAQILLKGETTSTDINLFYHIETIENYDDTYYYLHITQINTSKEWLNILLRKNLIPKEKLKFEIPPMAKYLL